MKPVASLSDFHSGVHFAGTGQVVRLSQKPAGQETSDLCHVSNMFRNPEVFQALPAYLLKQFPHGAPIYCYGASDGSEPYSLAMKFLELQGEIPEAQWKGFFPIQARELDPALVQETQEGLINVYADEEYDAIEKHTRFKTEELFEEDFSLFGKLGFGKSPHRVLPRLRALVHFEQGDVTEAVNSGMDCSKPCVLMFRNAWYHLNNPQKLAQDLFAGLKPGSLVIVGESERTRVPSVPLMLEQAGFQAMTEPGLAKFAYRRPFK